MSTPLFPYLYKPLFFQPFLLKLITISVIVLIARLLWSAIDYLLQSKSDALVSADRNKMLVKSIYPIIRKVLRAALVFITGILMLAELGYQLLPLLFSLGFFGLAVSFGAQSLVKDLINGVITLTENNIAIGDVVQIGQYVGTIEKISLRSLFLRHANGSLQTIPFSEVHNIINKSRDYTSFLVDLAVSYGSDLTKIYKILKETSDEMAKDPTFSNIMVEDIKIFGIDRFTENAVHVTALIKTVPDPRNYFGREFNYRLKQKLDKEGLFAPAYRQLVEIVYQDETKRVA
ncbi:MAG: mechanosensitive ion channel [Proteobacteria bacterium]|nr:mechanosensitive ion channel [Pseudomonadota bacterium]